MSHDDPVGKSTVLTPAEEELVALEAAAALATPGPWHVTGTSSVRDADEEMIATATAYNHNDLDAEFIAAASPSVVLKLIQRLRDTEHERDEMIRQHADTVKDRDENFRSMMRMVAMAAHWYEIAGDAMTAGLAECERLRSTLVYIRGYISQGWAGANLRTDDALREIDDAFGATGGTR